MGPEPQFPPIFLDPKASGPRVPPGQGGQSWALGLLDPDSSVSLPHLLTSTPPPQAWGVWHRQGWGCL